MPDDKAPDDWRNAVAREEAKQRRAVAFVIGEHLRFKLGRVVDEPLPARMAVLLNELRRRQSSGPSG
jgi:hypothetical protein